MKKLLLTLLFCASAFGATVDQPAFDRTAKIFAPSDLTIPSATNKTGTLSVTNDATIGGAATITGALSAGSAAVSGAASVAGALTASSGTVTNDLAVGGNATITGNATVSGTFSAATFTPETLTTDTAEIGTLYITNAIGVAEGGTGLETVTAGSLVAGNGTNAFDLVTIGDGLSLSGSPGSTRTLSATGEGGSGTEGTYAYATTTNNVAIPIWTNTLATGTGAMLSADLVAMGPTNKMSFKALAAADNPAGTAVLLGTNLTAIPDQTNMVAYWDVTGADSVLYVRGFDSEEVNWMATNIVANVVTNGAMAAAAAPAFEEQIGNFASSSASATTAVTLTSAVAAGNQVILLVSGTVDAVSATDLAANTYTLVADENFGGVREMQIFYAQATSSLEIGDTITVTWGSSGTSTVKHITAIEASGITEFDIDGFDSGNETDSTASVTTTAANTLIVGHSTWGNSGVSFTATSPTVQIGATKTFGFISAEYYKESSSLGVNSAGGTMSVTHSNYRQVAAFK